MARRVTKLEEQALELYYQIRKVIPEQYRVEPDECDMYALAWSNAYQRIVSAVSTVGELGDLLRGKVGITETGPVAQARQVYEASRPANDGRDGWRTAARWE